MKSLARVISSLIARRYEPRRSSSKLVAIVVPLSTRSELTLDEEISMRHLRRHFGKYDKYLIAPTGLAVDFEGFQVARFPRKYFGSAVAHNRLTYAPFFYRAFQDYEFIFFYHLDSLVFSDQLEQWCQTDLDYIGAPWIQCDDTPWVTRPRVGNGGFTLVRVQAALKVLAKRYQREPNRYWLDLVERNQNALAPIGNVLTGLNRRFPQLKILQKLSEHWQRMQKPREYQPNNDMFWADQARDYFPGFKIASVEEGLRFAFEAAPRRCFELNERKLPFGCHAWAKFDRAFWEPFLITTDEVGTRS
jgi:hypothetical protein